MTTAEQEGRADGATLRFRLPRQALRGGMGAELAPRAGESLEFQDYRDYTPGDDLRNLDWNVLARTDREVVKVRREEVAPVIEIFRDRTPSMSVPPAKNGLCDYLAALVETAAPNCRVVERTEPKTPHAVRVYLGDTLVDEDPDRLLARLSDRAAGVIVIRTLSREELAPVPGGAAELVDSESGERRELLLDSATVDAYLKRLADHTGRWREACRRHAAVFVDLAAELPRRERIAALAAAGLVEVRA